jgi:uncharacterized protein
MRQRRWLLIGLAALVATALAAFNFLAYRHAYAMKHFTAGTVRTGEPQTLTAGQKLKVVFSGVNIPRPRSNLLPSKLGPDCRSITLSGTNGIALGAWYCAASAPSPLVILFHGYAGEKTGTLPEAKAFLDMGASVLLVDFRGSGDSSASYTTLGYEEAEDVATAVRYARDHFDHPQVILYGQSMGAAAVLRAVHIGGVQPDALIVEAVFDRMLNAVRHRFEAMGVPSFPSAQLLVFWGGCQFGFNGFSHNPTDYAGSVKCPILFLHGAADPKAHVEEARRVFDAVPGAKQFREFAGVRHESAVVRYPEQWRDAVRQFLNGIARPTERTFPA